MPNLLDPSVSIHKFKRIRLVMELIMIMVVHSNVSGRVTDAFRYLRLEAE